MRIAIALVLLVGCGSSGGSDAGPLPDRPLEPIVLERCDDRCVLTIGGQCEPPNPSVDCTGCAGGCGVFDGRTRPRELTCDDAGVSCMCGAGEAPFCWREIGDDAG